MRLEAKKQTVGRCRSWHKWLIAAVVLLAAYFINVEVQTVLGERALAATGLETVSFEAALERGSAEKKLVLVDVSAIWCPSCRALDKEVFADGAVKALIRDSFVFSRLEYETEIGRAVLERYDASGFPTLLLVDGTGALVEHLPITYDPAEFVEILKDYL